jgi:tetratricopeptide (TPR) repeat protein
MRVRLTRFSSALLLVALVAVVVRVAYLVELNGSPLLSVLMGDSRQYDEWAVRIAAGQWMGTEVFYQTPLYPYALAVIFRLAGHGLGLVRVVQIILGSASCVILGLAGRRFFNPRVGVIAALLLAIYPPAIFFDGLIQKSSLDIFLVTLLLALLARFQSRPHWKWLVAVGAATAVFALNRENARVIYPVVAAWLLLDLPGVPLRHRLAWVGLFLSVSFVVLLPVGLRNYWVGGDFLLSTSQLGSNFYIGNNSHASGSYEPLVPGRGDPIYERADATRLASTAVGRPLSPSEVSDYWLRRSLTDIRDHPLAWIGLLGKKLLLTVNAAEIPDTESIEAYADYAWTLRGLLWLDFGVVLPAAALGAWLFRREWRRLLILYGLFVGLDISVALFYVVARYRHPLVPIVLLFSAAGLAGVFDLHWTRRWMPGLAAAAVVALVARVPMKVVHDETYSNLGTTLVQAGRATDAIPVLLKAVAVDPNYAAPHFNLGLAYRDTGQLPAALAELETAVRLRPDAAAAQSALGVMLQASGRSAEALQHLRESARLAPASVEARTNLGLALMEAGQPEEAVAEHRRAVALAPNDPKPHNNLAGALQQAGDVQQAIVEYRKALSLAPDYAEAHANLALALASIGDRDGAFQHFREAARLEPGNYAVHVTYGNALCESGRLAEGIGQYQEASRLSPNAIDPPYLSARAYARAGRFGDAVSSLQKALEIANATGQTDAARQIAEQLRQTMALADRRMR